MDSLTQIILGAAVGEIALGRKIGNRAMVWGAIGGTIPDLDVLANPFLDDIEALAFHRGITHSLFFTIVASGVFGSIVHRLYASRFHKSRMYKTFISILNIALLIGITWGLNVLFSQDGYPRWWFLFITCLIALFLLARLYRYYMIKELDEPQTTFGQWYWLFFLAFFTHIALDCFTAYGTQVFQPFSNYRVAFNNIAVVDPFYTIPFLICTIISAGLKRNSRGRRIVMWLGIGISSLYMLATLVNKYYVDRIFEKALEHRGITATRCRTNPTIFNNFLWSCTAEDQDQYYLGLYSIFDSDPHLHHLNQIPKNDSLHLALSGYKDYQTLLWFSEGYLASFTSDTMTVLVDLRFGGMTDTIRDQRDLVFNFKVTEENGEVLFSENREPPQGNIGEIFKKFIIRIKGY